MPEVATELYDPHVSLPEVATVMHDSDVSLPEVATVIHDSDVSLPEVATGMHDPDVSSPEVATGMHDPVSGCFLSLLLFHQRVLVSEQLHRQLIVTGLKERYDLIFEIIGSRVIVSLRLDVLQRRQLFFRRAVQARFVADEVNFRLAFAGERIEGVGHAVVVGVLQQRVSRTVGQQTSHSDSWVAVRHGGDIRTSAVTKARWWRRGFGRLAKAQARELAPQFAERLL